MPFYLLTALVIKLTSRGPVIYQQVRIGKKGKPFNFLKFRSMYMNSDNDAERKQTMQEFIKGNEGFSNKKIVNQKRITPIGKILRKYNLDELPQLFNVIKGDMSLVGPRPCITAEWKVYEDWQRLRLNTIPGCTGVWQVTGKGEVDFEETVLMDIFYNQNFSPWLDLKIILRTIPAMLLGKGDN
ncbi:MAG: hypothetical protein A3H98_02485 [Bacteroidetes bacterium RIFCSPLOWO2_02_FULL_36_8]|nr:MAG: hypothetical protein A3H98_02485 [Bacteroidetes bacterium RIFCSPLOWO2_02_FULL_36_8]